MQQLLFTLLYPLLWGISKLPFKALYAFSDGCYYIIYYLIGFRKKTVLTNLQLAFPNKSTSERKIIEKKFYRHLCDMFLEMIKSLSISKKELKKRFTYTNVELVKQFEEANQSIVLMAGHHASYEWLFSLQLYVNNPGYAIYKKIKSKPFDRLAHQIRSRWNTYLIDSKLALKAIKNLEQSGMTTIYGFAADQSPRLGRAKYWTQFLDHDLPFFTGAERTAKEFNLPVVFVAVKKLSRGHYQGTFQLLSERPKETPNYAITDAFAKALEAEVHNAPEHYFWIHKRFKLLGRKEEAIFPKAKV